MDEWGITIAHTVTPLLGIAALWWKITISVATKEDVNSFADNLQIQFKYMFDITIDLTREIRDGVRQMRSEIQELAGKIDANYPTFHGKIDNVANELRADTRR